MIRHLFIVSIPHTRGIVQYDTENMLALLHKNYRVVDREPDRSANADEILFTWECEEITDQKQVKYNVGAIGKNTRSNRF